MSAAASPRSILVTGGCGFIGAHLVRHLIGAGHRVANIDLLTYAANASALADLEVGEGYRFLHADIADLDAMRSAFARFRPDAVFHLAAESHVDRSIASPMEFLKTNVLGTASLLQAAREYHQGPGGPRDFRFVHVSTDEVYGALGPQGTFDEATAYDPHSPYSASKASSDHLARAWHATYGLPVIVTHCTNNYGAGQHPEKLIPRVIRTALAGEPIPVYGRGEQVRDWIHVADHCAALLRVLEAGDIGQTYCIGANDEWRNIDLVREICRRLDELRPRPDGASHAARIAFVADRPGHDFRYALDPSKLRRELGWRPRRCVADALKEIVGTYLGD